MVEEDFYNSLILLIKLNKNIIIEFSSFDDNDFEELDFVIDKIEFSDFKKNMQWINEKKVMHNSIIEKRFIMWYLQLSIKYFKCISWTLYKYLKVLSSIDSYRIIYIEMKDKCIQENIIFQIYNL